jgi:hypothetical protein
MNNISRNVKHTSFFFLISVLLMVSCSSTKEWNVPAELAKEWKSEKSKITVRTEPKWMKFDFISDSAAVSLKINADKTVSGSIGMASFDDGILEKNSGNPEKTGVAYIVKCGKIGKIFEKDPLVSKEIEIWLSLIKTNMEAEIRYTEKGSKFPMAGIVFEEVKD